MVGTNQRGRESRLNNYYISHLKLFIKQINVTLNLGLKILTRDLCHICDKFGHLDLDCFQGIVVESS